MCIFARTSFENRKMKVRIDSMESALTNVIPIPEDCSSISDGVLPIAPPKASLTGVSLSNVYSQPEEHGEKRWYVIRATYNRERKGYEYILSLGFEAFLPIQKKVVTIDGKEETKEQTLIPNLIFVRTDASGLLELLRGKFRQHYLNFCYDRTHKDDRGRDLWLSIPDIQMANFIRLTSIDNDHIMIVEPERVHYKSGDDVRIIDGVFKGITGRVARVSGQTRVVVSIEGVCSVATAYIPNAFLAPK